jgi:hypothetical protein
MFSKQYRLEKPTLPPDALSLIQPKRETLSHLLQEVRERPV